MISSGGFPLFVGFFFKVLFKEEEPIALPQFISCRMLFKVTALKCMGELGLCTAAKL